MEKNIETSKEHRGNVGLYGDNGKENGNDYSIVYFSFKSGHLIIRTIKFLATASRLAVQEIAVYYPAET